MLSVDDDSHQVLFWGTGRISDLAHCRRTGKKNKQRRSFTRLLQFVVVRRILARGGCAGLPYHSGLVWYGGWFCLRPSSRGKASRVEMGEPCAAVAGNS